MKGYVYILLLNNAQWYYGSSINVENRLMEHNAGKVKATMYKRPCSLLFVKEYQSIQEARKEEYKIKKMKNKKYIMKYMSFDSSMS